MKLERDVIIDLLPVYFSGEPRPATRAIVEDYFLEGPDFEKIARGASRPLEALQMPAPAPEREQEKAALERAREVVQTRASYLWLAICFTVLPLRTPLPQRTVFLWLAAFYSLMPFLFRIQDHKIYLDRLHRRRHGGQRIHRYRSGSLDSIFRDALRRFQVSSSI
jgi:heme exporter protein D